jgi:hypothetical protein
MACRRCSYRLGRGPAAELKMPLLAAVLFSSSYLVETDTASAALVHDKRESWTAGNRQKVTSSGGPLQAGDDG